MPQVKDAGYDGIEWAIDRRVTERGLELVSQLAEKNNLKIIAQHYDTVEADYNTHFCRYSEWLEKIKPFKWARISSQTGKDFFSFQQNKNLIDHTANYDVIHETHRGKFSFAAHVTKEYLEQIPHLRLTFDVSHWVNVAESYLEDQNAAVHLAVERADHIHARVGHSEGPQIPDPRVAEWNDALNKHLAWWDLIVERKRAANETLTITPEFGPFPYMVNVPRTGEPIADQWEVNVWMMELLRRRYG
jgi:hypothetical protein